MYLTKYYRVKYVTTAIRDQRPYPMSLGKSLFIGMVLLWLSQCASAITTLSTTTSPTAMPTNTLDGISEQQEIALAQQKILLEQQLIQVEQQLLDIRQQKLMQKTLNQFPKVNLSWQSGAVGSIPDNAIVAAYANDAPLYICHAEHQGIHPGQLSTQGCIITYAGSTIHTSTYQILVGSAQLDWREAAALEQYRWDSTIPFVILNSIVLPPSWHSATNNNSPWLPVPGGFEKGAPLYICRTEFNNVFHVGKVVADHCNIAVENNEIAVDKFQVLFVNLND
jgi:hypothetical protein